jgi:Flp pilus assembly protein TadG
MTDGKTSLFRRSQRDERGAVAVLVAAALVGLVGFGALVVDVSYYFYARSVVQSTANAAALAGAQGIGSAGTPLTTATTYSAVATDKNAVGNLTITMAAGYPRLSCATTWAKNSGVQCSINQTPSCATAGTSGCAGSNGANLITVEETANVPTFFGRIFGISSIPVSAAATASAAGLSTLTQYNVALILDTTPSMTAGATPAAGCGNVQAVQCAAAGAHLMLSELWPCASGLTSCAGTTPVDEAALFTFPPVANATQAADYYTSCTFPQSGQGAVTSWSGQAFTTSAATPTTSNTLTLTTNMTSTTNPTAAWNTGLPWAVVTDAGQPTTAATSTTSKTPNVLTFASGDVPNTVTGLVQDMTTPGAIPAGTTVSSVPTATTVMMSNNVKATVNSGDLITFGTANPIPAGTGNWPWWGTGTYISSVTLGPPSTAVMSAKPTGAGVLKGDTIIVAGLYQLVGFKNDYRTSDTAALNTASNIVNITKPNCLGAGDAINTYYADSIGAAQNALVAEQNARTTAGQLGGQNVMVLLTDGSAFNSKAMGPLEVAQSTYECGWAVLAAQAAAKAGTTVYVIYYDDGSPTCNDTATAPGLASTFNTPNASCTAMQMIANAPGATAGTYVNDQTKLFYSTDGTAAPCPSSSTYQSIASIFQHIVATLTHVRLVPPGTS